MSNRYLGEPDVEYNANVPLTPNAPGLNFGMPAHLRRNETEKGRLQGLMGFAAGSARPTSMLSVSSLGPVGQKGTTSKADLKKGVIVESRWTRFKSWMVNEGGRKIFTWTWITIHFMVFIFACQFILDAFVTFFFIITFQNLDLIFC